MTNRDALIILNGMIGLTNRQVLGLINHFGSAKEVLQADHQAVIASKILSEKAAINFTHFYQDDFLKQEFDFMQKEFGRILTIEDSDYPEALRHIPDSPLVLYIIGKMPDSQKPHIGVVGSRRASIYGRQTAQRFSSDLAQAGVVIVSGMAKGIDTSAHRGALQARGETLAVLGSGFGDLYPKQNINLAKEIIKSGALVSEFPIKTPPFAYNFPRRNRIVSGLSQGVLVVEAAIKSGALITVDFALEQGKDVYAVPGPVDASTSKGVHKLIRQGCKLVCSAQDILEDVILSLKNFQNEESCGKLPNVKEIDPLDQELINILRDKEASLESLSSKVRQTPQSVLSRLVKLEIKGKVKQKPGKIFQGAS